MAKAFSVASWNVEHFQSREPQTEAPIAFLADQRPDVIAIHEAEGAEVWRELMDAFPRYSACLARSASDRRRSGTATVEIATSSPLAARRSRPSSRPQASKRH
jgi:exonuclease III